MYDTRAKQQDQVIDTLQKTMQGMSKQIEALNTLLSAFMSQSHTHTNTQTQDVTSVDTNTTPACTTAATTTTTSKPTVTATSTAAAKLPTRKNTTTHAVNKTDITNGTPRLITLNYFTPLSTTTAQTPHGTTRETDTDMDPETAFSTLTSGTQPSTTTSASVDTTVARSKRHRENEDDADENDTSPVVAPPATKQKSSSNSHNKSTTA
jgi:hypothetical protein